MIYRNGFKEYFLVALFFGVPMGVLFGFSKSNLIVGVVFGALSGLLFALFLFVFIKIQEKNFDKKRIEIAKKRRVICDGGATINGNGGWLFLTENGLEFYPHKINVSTKTVQIPTGIIETVKTHRNQIVIRTADHSTLAIVVSHNKEWKKQIEATIR